MSAENLKISVSKDRLSAEIKVITFENTMEDIQKSLEYAQIKNGVLSDNIEITLANVHRTKNPAYNVKIAQCEVDDARFFLIGNEECVDLNSFNEFIKNLSNFNKKYLEKDIENLNDGIFLRENESFIKIEQSYIIDVFGAKEIIECKVAIQPSPNISVNKGEVTEFIAKKTGFLTINSKDELDLIDPFILSSDKMKLNLWLIPLKYGAQNFYDYYLSKIEKIKEKCELSNTQISKDDFLNLLSSDKAEIVLANQGVKPVEGNNALIENLVSIGKKDDVKDLAVDFMHRNKFTEVKERQKLLKKRKAIEGVPGYNALGDKLEPGKIADVEIKAGQNVEIITEGDYQFYQAVTSGLLKYTGKNLSVLEELVINNDISPYTGNIDFCKDIIINGNILSGYQVKGGRNITVNGLVESNSEIHCSGDLKVRFGIFGGNTRIVTGGSLSALFVQDSEVRSNGDVIINDYIYNSFVFSKKNITVKGKNVGSDDRGAVIGGKLVAMESVNIHSVGSKSAKTYLFCGINPLVQQLMNEAKETIQILLKKIIQTQHTLNFDIGKASTKDYINSLSPSEKEKVFKKLNELKLLIQKKDVLEGKLGLLQKKLYASDFKSLKICIEHNLIPVVVVTIADTWKSLNQLYNNVLILYKEKEIVVLQN